MADLGADVTRMLDHAENTVRYLAAKFGFADVGGVRTPDRFPDHPGGYAADYMVKDRAQGDALVAFSTANAAALGLDYQIWWGRVWDADKDPPGLPWEQWRPYTSTDNPHTDHVHQTYRKQPTAQMSLVGLKDSITGAAAKLFDVDAFMRQVEGTSLTLGAAMFGVALIGVGVVLAIRPAVRKAAQPTGA
jgi:hypothetical protein